MNIKLDYKPVIIVALLICHSLLSAQFSGGRGVSYDPFIVANARDLDLIREYPNSYFRQGADIDLDVDPWNSGEGWQPIGTVSNPFYGEYDGSNYKINGLYINREDDRDIGLFGFIHDVELRNITLENVNVFGYFNVGGLVGFIDHSIVSDCYVEGKFEGTSYYVGGLAGLAMYSIVSHTKSSGQVKGHTDTGGLIGASTETTIKQSGSNATVTGSFVIGGLVGNNYTLGGCRSGNTGGLAGLRNGTFIESSYAKGNVTGTQTVGGLVGNSENAFIYDSYSRGNVTGENRVGGLVGVNNDANITDSFSTGLVTGEQNIGGLIGHRLLGRIQNSYWDTETSQIGTSPAGEGRTTQQMTYPHHEHTYVGWDFDEIWADDADSLLNDSYPVLKWQIPIVYPYPNIAINPSPENEAANIPVSIGYLHWEFVEEDNYALPAGFRVYFNQNDDFDEEADFWWVDFIQDSTLYSVSIDELLPLDYDSTYYWKVVPTTIHPDERRDRTSYSPYSDAGTGSFIQPVGTGYHTVHTQENRHHVGTGYHTAQRKEKGVVRNDAEHARVWSFTTEIDTNVDLPDVPITTKLHQNYPNPFNPSTHIAFTLADKGPVTVDIYNNRGQKVFKLVDDYLPAGEYSVLWHGTDDQGNSLGSGVYFYRMRKGSYDSSGKMIMIK